MNKIRFDLRIAQEVKEELDNLRITKPRQLADFILNYQNLSIGKYDLLNYQNATNSFLNELKVIQLEQEVEKKKQHISKNL